MKHFNFRIAKLAGDLEQAKKNAIEDMIRERYSVSDELAIQRKRDKNPEEFAEYDSFVENVKAEVQAEIDRQLNNA